MGKNNTPKPAAAPKKTAKVTAKKKAAPVTPPMVIEPEVVVKAAAPVKAPVALKSTRKPAAVKTPKTPKATKAPAASKPATTYTQADVSLRAYFIAERRHSLGIHGNPHNDWVEAERQLAEEFAPKAKKPKAKKA